MRLLRVIIPCDMLMLYEIFKWHYIALNQISNAGITLAPLSPAALERKRVAIDGPPLKRVVPGLAAAGPARLLVTQGGAGGLLLAGVQVPQGDGRAQGVQGGGGQVPDGAGCL